MFKEFPVIELDVARLRQIRVDEDAENFYLYMTHPSVARFISAEDTPTSLESAKSELMYWSGLYRNATSVYWGIANGDDKLIGTCGFNSWNKHNKRAEISYDLAFECWGKGIMTRVIQSVTQFGFNNMLVRRIQATVSLDNLASIRVLEKCGYKLEGVLSQYAVLRGQSVDYYMYAITSNTLNVSERSAI